MLQIIEPITLASGQVKCPLCTRIMKTKQMIARHILVHTGEKPYACSQCNYSCNQKPSLERHFRSKHC